MLAAGLYAIFQAKEILLLILFSLVISLLFNPIVEYLQKKKFPRFLAATLVYSLAFGVFALLIYFFAPLLIIEISSFSQTFARYFEKISPPLRGLGIVGLENFESFVALIERSLAQIAQSVFTALFSIFGGVLTTIFVIFLAFFLSLEERAIEKIFFFFFPRESEELALELWRRCQKRVFGWFLSRLAASLFVGALTYLSFLIVGGDYPFSFGLLAGVSNFIPIVGPFFTGFLIFLMLWTTSPIKAVIVVIAFMIIQQIENNILTPILSKKLIGISPSLVLISLAIGGVLGGMWGAILGIPLMGIFSEFFKDFSKKKKEAEELNE